MSLISSIFSHFSQIENAVVFVTSQFVFLHATKAFLLSILCILPISINLSIDKLIEIGKIHKIESKNAFVACKNTNCDVTKTTAFSICEKCENIEEIKDTKISKYLKSFKDNSGMNYTRYNLELFGLCKKCK